MNKEDEQMKRWWMEARGINEDMAEREVRIMHKHERENQIKNGILPKPGFLFLILSLMMPIIGCLISGIFLNTADGGGVGAFIMIGMWVYMLIAYTVDDIVSEIYKNK